MLKNKKVIIFDLDGTLIDSVGIWNEIDETLIKEIGTKELDDVDIGNQRDTKLKEYRSLPDAYLEKGAVKEIKPNPEVHYKIINELNVKPEECLIVEDALVGVEAAKNAGIEVAVIYDKYSECNREQINQLANYQFENFNQMLETIKAELEKVESK